MKSLVIYKAVAWRERDRTGIERLLIAHRDQIDLQRVRRVVREFADALDEPKRTVEFDRLVERATGEERGLYRSELIAIRASQRGIGHHPAALASDAFRRRRR